MIKKIGKYLERKGFQKLPVQVPGLSIYFIIENGYINAIDMIDADGEPQVTAETLDGFVKKSIWKGPDGEDIDVHPLLVLFSSDMEKVRTIGEHQTFCWFVDTRREELVTDEGKCEDFYGMKAVLEEALTASEAEIFADTDGTSGFEEMVSEEVLPSKSYIPYMNYGLLVSNVILFILCIFFSSYFYAAWAFDPVQVLEKGTWYQFLTSMFLHGDAYHLASNMIYLYAVGDIVEKEMGHIRYFLLYMLSGILANGASLAVAVLTLNFNGSVGASGAVFGVTGALLWIAIRNRGRSDILTIPKMIVLILFSLYSGFVGTNIDNAAHVGGVIAGFVLAMFLYRKKHQRKERGKMQ